MTCACTEKLPLLSWSRNVRALLPEHDVKYIILAALGLFSFFPPKNDFFLIRVHDVFLILKLLILHRSAVL